ncbi:MAG: arsenate reductase ArsC [Actinomycetia bacterium]|nr:arsenate reductase ArsC [Actinomycetes bacterium]
MTSSVLFLCVHNAGRSQMAAGWLRHMAGDTVDVFSAGSQPANETNPTAVAVMAEVGIDITNTSPTRWTDTLIRSVDVVVTMGCGDTCPIYPATRYEDWDLVDPHGQSIEVVRTVRDDIHQRVRTLVATLDVDRRNPS